MKNNRCILAIAVMSCYLATGCDRGESDLATNLLQQSVEVNRDGAVIEGQEERCRQINSSVSCEELLLDVKSED